PLQPHIVKPEHAVPMKAFGLDLKVLLSTEDTGGAISVLMGWHKPGEGPGDHVHFSQEEMFFIVEGTYEMTVGGHTTWPAPVPSSSSRGTSCIASRTSATRRRACSTGACRVVRITTSKRSPNSPQTAASPTRR